MCNGDIVVVLNGAVLPVILRPVQGSQYYLMGERYIHDIAGGEAYNILGREGVKEQKFEII